MVERKRARKSAEKLGGFPAEERVALRERARELTSVGVTDGEADVLTKIAELPEPDRAMAQRIHAIVTATAPDLSPRTLYGMPAYAKDGTFCAPSRRRTSSRRGTRPLASATSRASTGPRYGRSRSR